MHTVISDSNDIAIIYNSDLSGDFHLVVNPKSKKDSEEYQMKIGSDGFELTLDASVLKKLVDKCVKGRLDELSNESDEDSYQNDLFGINKKSMVSFAIEKYLQRATGLITFMCYTELTNEDKSMLLNMVARERCTFVYLGKTEGYKSILKKIEPVMHIGDYIPDYMADQENNVSKIVNITNNRIFVCGDDMYLIETIDSKLHRLHVMNLVRDAAHVIYVPSVFDKTVLENDILSGVSRRIQTTRFNDDECIIVVNEIYHYKFDIYVGENDSFNKRLFPSWLSLNTMSLEMSISNEEIAVGDIIIVGDNGIVIVSDVIDEKGRKL